MLVCRSSKCLYMSRHFWFYECTFFYMFTVECIYICLKLFMYLCIYMHASLTREREREVPGGQFNCLRECCYFFPQFVIIISCKQILTFSVVKLTLLSFKHWQAKCHNRKRLQFFNVLGMFFWKQTSQHFFSYPFRIEQDYLQDKCIWDKLLRDKQ